MNSQATNQKLKRLMQDYEMGALNYDTYRQRRNAIIDEYAGLEKRRPPGNTKKMQHTDHESVSPYRAIFTLGLVLLAAIIAYIAISDENDNTMNSNEQFVDSSILPDGSDNSASTENEASQ